jgi:protein-tyrosine kinase
MSRSCRATFSSFRKAGFSQTQRATLIEHTMTAAKRSDQDQGASVIERAALRLESLQRTGIQVPWRQEQLRDVPSAEAVRPSGEALIERARQTPPALDAAAPEPALRAAPAVHVQVNAPELRPIARSVAVDVFSPAFVAGKTVADVDKARLSAIGYLVAGQDTRSRLAEEFRVVKRPLLQNTGDPAVRRGNVVMVTSSVAGEGKTFVSINLAMSIAAELNRQVILIEADSARPAVMERLGITAGRPGLMDALSNAAMSVNDVVLPTNIRQLAVIPAGKALANATELVASERMSRFIGELSEAWPNRIVLLDCPPLLQTTDARELAAHAGQVVLVVEAGRTKHALVKQSLAMLEGHPVVMPMLNKSPIANGTVEYGYYAY